MNRTGLVLGANGQDGTFLVRHLLGRGYRVVGIGIEPSPAMSYPAEAFSYRSVDVREPSSLARVLEEFRPDLVFHVAAVHTSASGGAYEPVFQDMLRVNVASVHVVLEYFRLHARTARLLYASSAKVFGEPFPPSVDEDTPIRTTCLYSLTKIAAQDLIRYYRRQHGLFCSFVYLFNHESELRGPEFFFPKLVACLVRAVQGGVEPATFGSLEFFRDWGSAEEYMSIAIDMLELAPGEDFVLASNRCTYARELVGELFAEHGLDYRQFIVERSGGARISEPYSVSLAKLRERVGRTPEVAIEDVVRSMVRSALGATGEGGNPPR